MGYNGMETMSVKVELSDDCANTIQHAMEIMDHQQEYMLTGDEEAAKGFDATVIELLEVAKEAAESADAGSEEQVQLQKVMVLTKEFDGYFDEYVDLNNDNQKVADEWRVIGASVGEVTEGVMVEIIDPMKTFAFNNNDLAEVQSWGGIDEVMNEAVTQHFLELRIQAIYYMMKQNEEQWAKFSQAQQDMKNGLDKWASVCNGIDLLDEPKKI